MYKPQDSISTLKGVGENIESKLKRENIKYIGDLINYFPFRHEDLSQIKTIAEIKQMESPLIKSNESLEKAVLKGHFKQITTFITKNRKLIIRAKLYDETGSIEVMWFNSAFIKQQLNETDIYLVTAKPSFYKNKLNIVNPTLEVSTDTKESTHTGRIVPVYFNINGIALRTLRKLIKEAVENIEIEDFLEADDYEIASGAKHLRNDKKRVKVIASNANQSTYLGLKDAYLNLHFPTTFEMIEKAKDRIGLNELIHVKLHSKKLKEITENKKSNFSIKKSFLKDFYPKLPFELTPDQQGAIESIEKLMSKKIPSNILVSGDVGSGKTLVAIASSFNTINNGGKVIYLAPTVVLAEQVYSEFCKYLQNTQLKIKNLPAQTKGENLKVEIQLVTSKTSKLLRHSKNNNESISKSDIIIGTHALLNIPNIEKFANLVIIDEQHKFGVKQRAKLIESNNSKLPHVVTMTATPIPRSLALTYFDELDLLPIKNKPAGRIPITTRVLDENKKLDCLKWIKTKVIKETKTYYIVPFIEKSKSILFENIKNITDTEKELKKYFGQKNVWVLHGKLKDNEKTQVINDFKSKKGGILLSTQVVEVGVDIKDATVIVIESAERFGLASLHQLRGRVGRSNLKSYCFLIPSTKNALESSRLKNLEKEQDGFKLAEMDLKSRGSGEIFGIRQSGELDLKFVNFGNEELIHNAANIANFLYENKEALQKYKDNFFTRDFFEIKDN